MSVHENNVKALELLEQLKPEILKNAYATTYYNALEESKLYYGDSGVRTQILYIMCNVRVPKEKKTIKDQILKLCK